MRGFQQSKNQSVLIQEFERASSDPDLPFRLFAEKFSVYCGRLPSCENAIKSLLDNCESNELSFPCNELMTLLSASENAEYVAPLTQVIKTFINGPQGLILDNCIALISDYLSVESLFAMHDQKKTKEKIILELRESSDRLALYRIYLAHSRAECRTEFLVELLEYIGSNPTFARLPNSPELFTALSALADLDGHAHSQIRFASRSLLLSLQPPTYSERHESIFSVLKSAAEVTYDEDEDYEVVAPLDAKKKDENENSSATGSVDDFKVQRSSSSLDGSPASGSMPTNRVYNFREQALHELVDSPFTIFDVLPVFFYHEASEEIQNVALEAYARRAYHTYHVYGIRYIRNLPFRAVEWHFKLPGPDSESEGSNISSRIMRHSLPWSVRHETGVRVGIMVALKTLDELESQFKTILSVFPRGSSSQQSPSKNSTQVVAKSKHSSQHSIEPVDSESLHVLNVALLVGEDDVTSDEVLSDRFTGLLRRFEPALRKQSIRRATIILVKPGGHFPRAFTFRDVQDFAEDRIIRHLEPAHAFQLELNRLNNFSVTPVCTKNKSIYLYHAIGKENSLDSRFFVRVLVRPGKLASAMPLVEYLKALADSVLTDALDALELASATHPKTDCNHLFINFLPQFPVNPEQVNESFGGFIMRHGRRLWKLRVTAGEVRFVTTTENGAHTGTPYRYLISNVSGILKAEAYQEVRDHRGEILLSTIDGPVKGTMHLFPAQFRYPNKEKIQPKRHRAHELGTTYVYDYIELFREAVARQWTKYSKVARPAPGAGADIKLGPSRTYSCPLKHTEKSPEYTLRQDNKCGNEGYSKERESAPNDSINYVRARELVLDAKSGELIGVERESGSNSCGMVAWEMVLVTPEAPKGRKVVVIANDITHAIGSFGPEEDEVFLAASRYARANKIPRIYISANSGARIGLATEVLDRLHAAWKDSSDTSKGFEYLYLTEEDYSNLKDSVNVERVVVNDLCNQNDVASDASGTTHSNDKPRREVRMRIVDIIGAKDGLGVECLRGSAKIAGETSQAYDEIFTLSIVTCRSVGIGAYLVRLGQRVIQVEGQPIILTGSAALNKVLGREVYTSNLQLGGTQIMYRNGISHLTASDCLESVCQAVRWLSFVPIVKGEPLPILFDESRGEQRERDVEFEPTSEPYDPRHMIAGRAGLNSWEHGLFDRGSFVETMSGWSRSVVTGRARLAGIPVGVIAVETRTMESTIPADPANPDSAEQVTKEAPGVWTPESAFKTAQAMRDMHREQLPLFVLANWRGFSGGQRDMYDGVLKSGSWIVDALRAYVDAPVFVYIIPHGELRGGAWVVLDPTIQSDTMELYADEKSRAGVLEAEAVIEIKLRGQLRKNLVERLSQELSQRQPRNESQQSSGARIKSSTVDEIALRFAELHDTPGRMLAKGTVRRVIQWRGARKFFIHRLQRLLAERVIVKDIIDANGIAENEKEKTWVTDRTHVFVAREQLREWYAEDGGVGDYDREDARVDLWLREGSLNLARRVEALRFKHVTNLAARLLREYPSAAAKAMTSALMAAAELPAADYLRIEADKQSSKNLRSSGSALGLGLSLGLGSSSSDWIPGIDSALSLGEGKSREPQPRGAYGGRANEHNF